MSTPDTTSDDAELDKILTELEKTVEEKPSSEDIKDKQASKTLEKLKHEKPDWADKDNDDNNIYEYSDKIDASDDDW